MFEHINPFYDNHRFTVKDTRREKLVWQERVKCLFHPMKAYIATDGYVYFYKARRGAYYYFYRKRLGE